MKPEDFGDSDPGMETDSFYVVWAGDVKRWNGLLALPRAAAVHTAREIRKHVERAAENGFPAAVSSSRSGFALQRDPSPPRLSNEINAGRSGLEWRDRCSGSRLGSR